MMCISIKSVVIRVLLVLAAGAVAGDVVAEQKIEPTIVSFEQPEFGKSLAIDRGELAIGAPRGTAGGNGGAGYVSLYRRDASGWQPAGQILPVDADSTFFGVSVAMGGGWLAVAGRREPPFFNAYVYLFRRGTGGAWEFAQRLPIPAASHSGVVSRMAVSSTTLAAAYEIHDGEGGLVAIRTVLYDYANGAWNTTPYEPVPPYTRGHFGAALVLNETTLVIGDTSAMPVSGRRGAVSTFVRTGNSWAHASLLTMALPAIYSFGENVALCGNYLAVSTRPYPQSPPTSTDVGSVVVYSGTPLTWTLDGTPLVPPAGGPSGFDHFAESLSCDGDTLAIGDPKLKGAYLVGLGGPRTLQPVSTSDPAGRPGVPVLMAGGTVLASDPRQGGGLGVGAVYAFNDAIETIFSDSFE